MAMSDTKQAGSVEWGGPSHACIWSGTPESCVDLHPPVAAESSARAISGDTQAGYTVVDDVIRAAAWIGTPESWIDLHALLPADFSSSQATGAWTGPAGISICGWGFNQSTGHQEALLWTLPNCTADFNHDGFVNGDDYDAFASLFESADLGADINHDSFVNGDDYDAFASAFEAGC